MAPNAQNYDPGVIPGLLSKLKGLGRSKASIARQLDVSRSTLHNNVTKRTEKRVVTAHIEPNAFTLALYSDPHILFSAYSGPI